MRTCPKCGCYIPDNWINCPACDAKAAIDKKTPAPHSYHNTTSKVFPNGVYRVKIYYKDDTMTDTLFGLRDNALKHAQSTIDKFWYCVQFIEVWDCLTQARIGLFYPNS